MKTRTADARWEGGFPRGSGNITLGSGAFEGPYSFGSRFEEEKGTNPEELIGAAEAGCFSMALSKLLTESGHVPRSVHTTAKVHLDKSGEEFAITKIDLELVAEVPDIEENYLKEMADKARRSCIVSRTLAATDISLSTKLLVASH